MSFSSLLSAGALDCVVVNELEALRTNFERRWALVEGDSESPRSPDVLGGCEAAVGRIVLLVGLLCDVSPL